MSIDDFDSSHLDGIEDATQALYNELESGHDAEIRLRPGYDEAPLQHDLQLILNPESQRFQESESDMVEDLYGFVDEYFGDMQYVDWSMSGFEELCPWEEEVFTYDDGTELKVEVYEPGAEGHDILRL